MVRRDEERGNPMLECPDEDEWMAWLIAAAYTKNTDPENPFNGYVIDNLHRDYNPERDVPSGIMLKLYYDSHLSDMDERDPTFKTEFAALIQQYKDHVKSA